MCPYRKCALAATCSVFAMLFGSGNIVFPFALHQLYGHEWFASFCGFCVSAVFLPVMILVLVMTMNAESERFFSPLPKCVNIALQMFILSLNGPIGVAPRCATVAYSSIPYVGMEMPLVLFSALFCIGTYFMIVNGDRIMDVTTRYLMPPKMLALIVPVIVGVYSAGNASYEWSFGWRSFWGGIEYGYLSMDMAAAVYFAPLIYMYVDSRLENHSLRDYVHIGVLSIFLLCSVYIGFWMLADAYSAQLVGVPAEECFQKVIALTCGEFAPAMIVISMVIACFTTAVAFIAGWIMFLTKMTGWKYSYVSAIAVVLMFFVSLTEFSVIIKMMLPCLHIICPILFAVSLLHLYRMRRSGWRLS